MKRENDELTDLFRSRLSNAEMTVREGFWNEVSASVSVARRHRKLVLTRLAAAASVLLVLGMSSAAFWYFSPKDEIEQAFTQIAATSGVGSLHGDAVRQEFNPVQARPVLQKPTAKSSSLPVWNVDEEEMDSVSVTFSMSFSFTATSTPQRRTNDSPYAVDYWQAGGNGNNPTAVANEQKDTKNVTIAEGTKPRKRAVKAAVGTALPAANGTYKMPFSAVVTLEQPLGKKLSVEAGVQYTNLRSTGQNLHYIGVPVKLNYKLADTRKLDWYATLGGVIDKCIAGAPDNSFSAEPVQLALTAGIALNYKINDKIALFAEPGVSYHFKTDSALETVRTERPVNFNLLCGVRMTY